MDGSILQRASVSSSTLTTVPQMGGVGDLSRQAHRVTHSSKGIPFLLGHDRCCPRTTCGKMNLQNVKVA